MLLVQQAETWLSFGCCCCWQLLQVQKQGRMPRQGSRHSSSPRPGHRSQHFPSSSSSEFVA